MSMCRRTWVRLHEKGGKSTLAERAAEAQRGVPLAAGRWPLADAFGLGAYSIGSCQTGCGLGRIRPSKPPTRAKSQPTPWQCQHW